ncbi:hypothetical protein RI367_004315 [Sorochytrium milnesiophthora]
MPASQDEPLSAAATSAQSKLHASKSMGNLQQHSAATDATTVLHNGSAAPEDAPLLTVSSAPSVVTAVTQSTTTPTKGNTKSNDTAAAAAKRKSMSIGNISQLDDVASELEFPPHLASRVSNSTVPVAVGGGRVGDAEAASDGHTLAATPNVRERDTHTGALSEDQASQDERDAAAANVDDWYSRGLRRFIRHFPELSKDVNAGTQIFQCQLERDKNRWSGKLVITDGHLCFHGRLGNKGAKVTIAWRDIIVLERKPLDSELSEPCIKVMTLNSKYTFVAFADFDVVFSTLNSCWKTALDALKHESQVPNTISKMPPDIAASLLAASAETPLPEATITLPRQQHPHAVHQAEGSDHGLSDSGLEAVPTPGTRPASRVIDKRALKLSVLTSERQVIALRRLPPTTTLTDVNIVTHPIAAVPGRSNMPITHPSSSNIAPLAGQAERKDAMAEPSTAQPSTSTDEGSTPQSRRTTVNELFQRLGKKIAGGSGAATPASTPSSQSSSNAGGGRDARPPTGGLESAIAACTATVAAPLVGLNEIDDHSVGKASAAGDVAGADASAAGLGEAPAAAVRGPDYPAHPTTCGCSAHLKHPVLDEMFEMDVQDVWRLLFQGDSQLFRAAHSRRETENIQFLGWSSNEETGKRERNITYRVSFTVPFQGKKVADCTETQTLLVNEDFVLVIEVTTKTPGVPFGEHFSTVSRVCVTYVAPKRCRILVTFRVDFTKSLMWEGKIERGATDGCSAAWKEFAAELHAAESTLQSASGTHGSGSSSKGPSGSVGLAILLPNNGGASAGTAAESTAILRGATSPTSPKSSQAAAAVSVRDRLLGALTSAGSLASSLPLVGAIPPRKRIRKLLRRYNSVLVAVLCLLTMCNTIALLVTSHSLSNSQHGNTVPFPVNTAASFARRDAGDLYPAAAIPDAMLDKWATRVGRRLKETREELNDIRDVLQL